MNATGFGASPMSRFESGSDASGSWRVRGINCRLEAFDILGLRRRLFPKLSIKIPRIIRMGKGTAIHLPMFADKSRLSLFRPLAHLARRAIVVRTLIRRGPFKFAVRLALLPRGNLAFLDYCTEIASHGMNAHARTDRQHGRREMK